MVLKGGNVFIQAIKRVSGNITPGKNNNTNYIVVNNRVEFLNSLINVRYRVRRPVYSVYICI